MIANAGRPSRCLRGRLRVPGDKSIAHRALLLGAMAEGTTSVEGFPPSEDCLATLRCLRRLGAEISYAGPGSPEPLLIQGRGPGGLHEPEDILDTANSGTALRLLAGLVAGLGVYAVLTGDSSLRRRPMRRIVDPLTRMGAAILGRGGGQYAPLAIQGALLRGIDHTLPVASAQVKSSILLAGLSAAGETVVREPEPTRDHTERMLAAMGADISREGGVRGGSVVHLRGGSHLRGLRVPLPGDISSAAFFLVAAAITPGSEVVVEGVGVNPTRTGILDVLREMGADVWLENWREEAGEPVADVGARASRLAGVEIGGALVPRVIDELPIIAVAATQAEGRTVVSGAAELRVKETDRIAAIVAELSRLGAQVQELPDGFAVEGPSPLRGGFVCSYGDHRIAMAMAVADLVSEGEVAVEGQECVAVSYPGFYQALNSLNEGCQS